MKVIDDQVADTMTTIFTDTPVAESDEDKPGIILDYDDKGNLVSLEMWDASRRVSVPSKIEYQVSPMAGWVEELRDFMKQSRSFGLYPKGRSDKGVIIVLPN